MKLEKAIKVLQKELEKDQEEGSYYHSWKANIAIAFQDEYKMVSGMGKPNIHKISNDAADRFLQQLISSE